MNADTPAAWVLIVLGVVAGIGWIVVNVRSELRSRRMAPCPCPKCRNHVAAMLAGRRGA